MRTSVHLPDELLRQAKRKAAAEGRTLTSLIEEGLRLVVTGTRSGRTGRRQLPRVSKAQGGFAPRFDPVKFATQIQEEEDDTYLARLLQIAPPKP